MIPDITPSARYLALALFLSLVLAGESQAKPNRPATSVKPAAESVERSVAADNLAAQVAEIANSAAISKAKKEKRISTTVRIAVVAATAYKKDPEDILGVALELAASASRVAPHYPEVIANAVSFAPSLARIDSAPGKIRSAAYAAAKGPKTGRKVTVATKKIRQPARPVAEELESSSTESSGKRTVHEEIESPVANYPADSVMQDEPSTIPSLSLNNNSKFSVTAELSVRRDDNVYLTSTDKVSDSIIAVTPGVEFRFGQNSLAHGSLNYKTAFTRYADKTAPNVSLGSGSADFGYDSGSLAINANGSFQQINQNSSEVAALGQKAIFRRDLLGLNASVESHLTAKTSVRTGANYSKSEYKIASLTGSQEIEVPLKFYFETTPKVSLSTGASYRRVTPQNGGERGKDLDYNVGARGNFTAKLNGEFSLDYRTRDVGNNAREKLWGFNGALNYEITPKTTSALVFSRDFSTGALGESLKNSTYSFRLSTDLTPQWQLGAGVSYRRVEYGPAVFRLNNTPTQVDRNDNYWEGNVQASYLFSSWLSATADYTFRRNNSTLPGAEYSNSILSLMLGLRY